MEIRWTMYLKRSLNLHVSDRISSLYKNPLVRKAADLVLGGVENIVLLGTLDVSDFHNILARSHCVSTDSGSIQKNTSFLSIPVFILGESTERTKDIKVSISKLVRTNEKDIFDEIINILADKKMSKVSNLYRDGNASKRIVDAILYDFGMESSFPKEF